MALTRGARVLSEDLERGEARMGLVENVCVLEKLLQAQATSSGFMFQQCVFHAAPLKGNTCKPRLHIDQLMEMCSEACRSLILCSPRSSEWSSVAGITVMSQNNSSNKN